jgi:hypothetical protein
MVPAVEVALVQLDRTQVAALVALAVREHLTALRVRQLHEPAAVVVPILGRRVAVSVVLPALALQTLLPAALILVAVVAVLGAAMPVLAAPA